LQIKNKEIRLFSSIFFTGTSKAKKGLLLSKTFPTFCRYYHSPGGFREILFPLSHSGLFTSFLVPQGKARV